MSPKKWSKNTFGWARAEVLGALVNSVFLVALCFSILVESIKRYHSPSKSLSHMLNDINLQFSFVRFIEVEDIHNAQLILVVGAVGLGVNIIGLFLFHGEYNFPSNRFFCFQFLLL